MGSEMRQKLDRMLRDLPEESLPQVLKLVQGLSHQSQKRTGTRFDNPPSRKKRLGGVTLPADPEAVEALLREEVGFGVLPAPRELVYQVMEEDLYELE